MNTHNGLLRSGELLALNVGDLIWDSQTECRIRIVESKTNQLGMPGILPYINYAPLSGAHVFRKFWDRFELAKRNTRAPLFTRDPANVYEKRLSKDLFVKGFGGSC